MFQKHPFSENPGESFKLIVEECVGAGEVFFWKIIHLSIT